MNFLIQNRKNSIAVKIITKLNLRLQKWNSNYDARLSYFCTQWCVFETRQFSCVTARGILQLYSNYTLSCPGVPLPSLEIALVPSGALLDKTTGRTSDRTSDRNRDRTSDRTKGQPLPCKQTNKQTLPSHRTMYAGGKQKVWSKLWNEHLFYKNNMCHSSRPFCTRHVPGFGLVGRTPGPSKILSRRDGLLGRQARVRRAPLYACGWIRLRMLAHA